MVKCGFSFTSLGSVAVSLVISGVESVAVSSVELAVTAEDRTQTVVVRNVDNLKFNGMINCRMCRPDKGKFDLKVRKYCCIILTLNTGPQNARSLALLSS